MSCKQNVDKRNIQHLKPALFAYFYNLIKIGMRKKFFGNETYVDHFFIIILDHFALKRAANKSFP